LTGIAIVKSSPADIFEGRTLFRVEVTALSMAVILEPAKTGLDWEISWPKNYQ